MKFQVSILTRNSSETGHFSIMKKLWDLKKVYSNLEPERQGRGIIMGVTRLLLLGPFYTIKTNFMYFFAHDCSKQLVTPVNLTNYLISRIGSTLPKLKTAFYRSNFGHCAVGQKNFGNKIPFLSYFLLQCSCLSSAVFSFNTDQSFELIFYISLWSLSFFS